MKARELKDKFVNFFISKSHAEIPSASLVPENDPTTLFISAGMHPLVPYLLGQPHALGKRLVDVQKCVRTGDIDEVGDTFHHTFFEMLGNWSLGDYFKKEMIPWSYEFLTKILNLPHDRLAVSCFIGDENAPKDTESSKDWEKLGFSIDRIAFLPKANNWWGPAGATGPCGPDTEMFYWVEKDIPVKFDPSDNRWLEIWNDVFMQFNKDSKGKYVPLAKPNVDTGMGVERTVAVLSGFAADNYLTDIWQPIIKKIEKISNKKYQDEPKAFRIIADHIRSAVFIIADGVQPSNKEAGYVLRRLIRRAIRQGKLLGIETNFVSQIAQAVVANKDNYAGIYPEIENPKVLEVLSLEESRFRKTLNNGLREIQKLIDRQKSISGKEAFTLYESFGFPVELIQEELIKNKLALDLDEFNQAKSLHSELSKTLSAGKFKSGLVDHSEITTKYHTATHMLQAALRLVLGNHVSQTGSNLTPERLRFDFNHPDKLTDDQIKHVEEIVNQKIGESLPVSVKTMKFEEAKNSGALAFFGTKYPEVVTVYSVGDFSKEVCTGPHVKNTSELGKFKITKQEASGSGKRRIYAILI